jgi:hypothetical protein
MSHPGPLLTDFVDGALGAADRAEVEAHISGCAQCRREVVLAGAARSSLRTLHAAVPPPGLADAAIAQAEAGPVADIADARSPGPSRRWIAIAAAAAVIIVIAVASPKLGSSPSQTSAAGAGGSADRSFAEAETLDVVHADLSAAQLATAAAALGGVQAGAESAPTSDASGVSGAMDLPDLRPSQQLPERLPEASACLDQAWGATPGQLTRVILARFDGKPAYLGLYAIGPGAGLPPTRLQLLVASVGSCQALGSGYALL